MLGNVLARYRKLTLDAACARPRVPQVADADRRPEDDDELDDEDETGLPPEAPSLPCILREAT